MLDSIKQRVADALSTRALEAGDVVRVAKVHDESWEAWDHPVGGPGHWAIYIKGKYLVRPIREDLSAGDRVQVQEVEVVEDVVLDEALKAYYLSKGKRRPARRRR